MPAPKGRPKKRRRQSKAYAGAEMSPPPGARPARRFKEKIHDEGYTTKLAARKKRNRAGEKARKKAGAKKARGR